MIVRYRLGAKALTHRARIWLVWCATALSAGCLHEASETCGNGGVCPVGLLCVDTGGSTVDGRICAVGTCGNGRLDPGESCDDGNNRSGDGCPADCTQPCGDGVRDPGEACDDGNSIDGDGCSADCKSVDGSFRISPPIVSFAATEGDPLPAAVTVTVHLQYRGDVVLVGYEPGTPLPTWLSVADGPTTAASAELQLRVTDTSAVGQRSTSVKLLVNHMNSAGVETFDLPVSYRVQRSDLAVEATPVALTFSATTGDLVVPPQTVDLTFNGQNAMVVSAPLWADVSAPLSAVSPASFTVTIKDTSFNAGTTLSDDIIFGTTRGALERRSTVHVTYHVVAPSDLAVAATPSALVYTATVGDPIPASQTVDVTYTGASITVVSAPAWTTVTSPPAPLTSPASFAVAVNTTSFAGATEMSGDIVFRTTRGSEQRSTTVHLGYHVLARPEVQFVAPYVGIAGQPGTVRIRGHGFPASSTVTVGVGDLAIGPVTPDSDTQITVSYPALPEGRYPVMLVQPAGIAPRAPELVIVPLPPFAYQAIDAPGQPSRLVYDAERQAIYVLDWQNQQILHFVYSNGTWSARPRHVVPELTDIAMAPDGRSLIVIERSAIHEMSLTDGLFTLTERVHFPMSLCSYFGQAAAADNGKIFVFSGLTGTGYCPAYFYDMLDHSLVESGMFIYGRSGSSSDGSRIYAGRSLADTIQIYDSLSNTMSSSPLRTDFYAISVSRDASRVILDDRQVYGRSLGFLGNVPYQGSFATLVSRDARCAFIFPYHATDSRLEVYDLGGPLQSGDMYPLRKTVMVPDAANGSNEYAMAMTSSLDDAVVFVAGASKLLVIPLDYVAPPDLAVAATPSALAFTATAGDAIPASQAVDVTYTGASVAAVSAPSWVTVTSPPAPVTSPASFAVAVNTTSFARATELSGDLVFRTTRGSEQRSTTVHLDYHVLAPPEVQFVAPYVGIVGRPGTVRIRGHGFPASSTVTVSVGDLVIGPVIPDSDTQITVSYPGLPEGRYPVTLVHPVGIAPRAPELVIVPPPSFTYQAIDAPGQPSRLVYDAERQAIYVLDWQNQQILHFVYSNNTWSARPRHVIPELTDIAMAPDGRSLIVIKRSAIHEMSLTDGLFTLVERVHFPTSLCSYFTRAAAADNGKIFVFSDLTGSGYCPAYFYDMLDHSLMESESFVYSCSGSSGDGSRIYAGRSLVDTIEIYDSLSNTMSSSPLERDVYSISVSRDASRVIMDDRQVYDRSLGFLGNVPYQGSFATLVSRDASRAFIYPYDWIHPRLEVYDLNGPLQSGAMYPLVNTITVPDIINDYNHYAMAMTSTPDDAVVFVAGAFKLLVVPVN